MFLADILIACLVATLLVVRTPGSDKLRAPRSRRPRTTGWFGIGASASCVVSGLSILALGHRR